MHKGRRIYAATLLLLLAVTGGAIASPPISLIVDPGPTGQVSGSFLKIDLPQLMGMQGSRDATLIDVRFDHGKYIDLQNLSSRAMFGYYLDLDYTPSMVFMTPADGVDGSGGDYTSVYYLFDEAGQPLHSWDSLGITGQPGQSTVSVLRIGFDVGLDQALITGVHMGFDASGDFQLTGATLNLYLREPGVMRIGRVPEPASASLAIVVAVSLVLASRRRPRTSAGGRKGDILVF